MRKNNQIKRKPNTSKRKIWYFFSSENFWSMLDEFHTISRLYRATNEISKLRSSEVENWIPLNSTEHIYLFRWSYNMIYLKRFSYSSQWRGLSATYDRSAVFEKPTIWVSHTIESRQLRFAKKYWKAITPSLYVVSNRLLLRTHFHFNLTLLLSVFKCVRD